MNVTKSNGELQEFSWEKIEAFYKRVNHWLNVKCPFSTIKENLNTYLVDWISTENINKMIIKSAIDLISTQNISWQKIAGRMTMRNLYKQWERTTWFMHSVKYSPLYLEELIKTYTEEWLYNKKIIEAYSPKDMSILANEMKGEYDMDYVYGTVMMYAKRYLLNPKGKGIRELPQHMYMINAMFLWMDEPKETRLEFVKDLYRMTTVGEISLPTPTLLNARTPNSQLSSCFIMTPADDLRSIYHNIEGMAQISKNWWGIWVYLWNIRSKGASIKGEMGLSGWVLPWVKVINDTAIAVNQMGKRAGAISVTLDVFHKDIYDWLEMQTETGDIRTKAFDVFPSVSFPDEFMKRVELDASWTLFDPKEIEDVYWKRLQDHFGQSFVAFYEELEQDPRLVLKTIVQAKDLYKHYLKSVVETWMPYSFYRDTVNATNPNKHAGSIYCTNLCTEIAQNQSENIFIIEEDNDGVVTTKFQSGDTVICNLASINVAKVNSPDKIAEVVPVAMRTLDNVIELNAYPIKETEISAKKYRAVGLGMMGLAQYFAENKIVYGSPESVEATASLFEDIAYETLKSSVDLAKQRWAYPMFEGSEYSKGIAFGKDLATLGSVDYNTRWLTLKEEMKKSWTRFGYHSSPAPNTSTGLVVGTTAWIVPVYKKYFVETNQIAPTVTVAPNLNADNFWFYKDYVDIELGGVIDVVSEAQKWIDQSISFEWLINPQKTSPKDLYLYFFKAWKQGIKTVYYVRSQSLEIDTECESCTG